MVSTADVRPVGDVLKDLRNIMVRKLPGGPDVCAAWSALCEAGELFSDAVASLAEINAMGKIDELDERRRSRHYGQKYAAAVIIRKIADAYGVSNFRDGVDV